MRIVATAAAGYADVLRAPLAVCTSRAANRDASRLADTAVVERIWRDFADLGTLERHLIESDGAGADRIAELIVQRLQDGLLAV